MWELQPTDEYARRHKRFAKDRPRELQAALDNLDTYVQCLAKGTKPMQIRFRFVRSEPQGIFAISEQGGGANLAPIRMYVVPDLGTETLHLITIGDKKSQRGDIQFSKEYTKELLKQKEESKHGIIEPLTDESSAKVKDEADEHDKKIQERSVDGDGSV